MFDIQYTSVLETEIWWKQELYTNLEYSLVRIWDETSRDLDNYLDKTKRIWNKYVIAYK